MTLFAGLLLLASVARPDGGGCLQVKEDVVRVEDLAQVFAFDAEKNGRQEVLRAPVAGKTRLVSQGEVESLLTAHGIAAEPRAICIERQARQLSQEELRAAMRAVFPDDSVQIEILDISRYPVPFGPIEFSRSGLMASSGTRPRQTVLWRGKVLAERTAGIWARVRLSEKRKCVIAADVLLPGEPIRSDDIRVEEREFFPLASPPVESADEIIGKEPVRRIAADTILDPRWLRTPALVKAGTPVDVEVRQGAILLRIPATAEADGGEGDRIWLRTAQGVRIPGVVVSKEIVVAEEKAGNVPPD